MTIIEIENRLEEIEEKVWRINISTDFYTKADRDYLEQLRNERYELLLELNKKKKEALED